LNCNELILILEKFYAWLDFFKAGKLQIDWFPELSLLDIYGIFLSSKPRKIKTKKTPEVFQI